MVFAMSTRSWMATAARRLVMWRRILRDRPSRDFVRGTPAVHRGTGPANEAITAWPPVAVHGAKDHHASIARCCTDHADRASPARTCRRSITASRWTRSLTDSHGIPAPKIDYTIGEHAAHDGARHRPARGDLQRLAKTSPLSHRAWNSRATCWAPRAWAWTSALRSE